MPKTTLQNLYQADFVLWVENTVDKLKARNYLDVDWENLTKEIEALAGRERRELESLLTKLFEHLLKGYYVNTPEFYRCWQLTISRTQQEMKRIIRDSPSLRDYYLAIRDECYQDAIKNVTKEHDNRFPEICTFPQNLDVLLNSSIV